MNIKLLFFPFALVVLIWSVLSATKPSWDQYKIKKAEVTKLTKAETELRSGLGRMQKALMEYENLGQETRTYIENAIPTGNDHDNLVAELNKNASQSGVLVVKIGAAKKKHITTAQCKQKNNVDSLDCNTKASATKITLSTVGVYPSIKRFLGKLDNQNRIIIPNSIYLVASKNDKENSVAELVTGKMDFAVFQKEPTKIKSFSKVMAEDHVLQSLLTKGLDVSAIKRVKNIVTSGIFLPVQVDGAGKDDLFKRDSVNQEEPAVNN